jgi:ribonuclease HI
MNDSKLIRDLNTPPGDTPLPQVYLFTDGACLGNPGPGGWAYILEHPATGKRCEQAGGEECTTNNRMELTAVIEGLSALHNPSAVRLCSDSQYVLKGLSEWMPQWKKRNWRKADRRPVLNAELWQRLDEMIHRHRLEFDWVRGHSGHPENERCDELAQAQARLRM